MHYRLTVHLCCVCMFLPGTSTCSNRNVVRRSKTYTMRYCIRCRCVDCSVFLGAELSYLIVVMKEWHLLFILLAYAFVHFWYSHILSMPFSLQSSGRKMKVDGGRGSECAATSTWLSGICVLGTWCVYPKPITRRTSTRDDNWMTSWQHQY